MQSYKIQSNSVPEKAKKYSESSGNPLILHRFPLGSEYSTNHNHSTHFSGIITTPTFFFPSILTTIGFSKRT